MIKFLKKTILVGATGPYIAKNVQPSFTIQSPGWHASFSTNNDSKSQETHVCAQRKVHLLSAHDTLRLLILIFDLIELHID